MKHDIIISIRKSLRCINKAIHIILALFALWVILSFLNTYIATFSIINPQPLADWNIFKLAMQYKI
jgi:hypothetical protein